MPRPLPVEINDVVFDMPNLPRGLDSGGNGAFAASRGSRPHRGRDFLYAPGEPVKSLITGRVARIGYPYSREQDPARHYRLVEIVGFEKQFILRAFYVSPCVQPGEFVTAGDIIGQAQDIAKKYGGAEGGMGNHVHFEVLVDPMVFMKGTNEDSPDRSSDPQSLRDG